MNAVEQQLQRARDFLGTIPRAAEMAMSRALNKAATIGRDEAIRAIDERYAVKPSDVRDKITIRPATPDRLVVSVVARSGSLALGYFPHAPEAIGTGGPGMPNLSAEILRGQSRDVLGAFVAPIGGKARIMKRTGGKTSTGKTAIKSVYSVPIALMLGAESVREAVETRALAVIDEQLDREIDRALGKIS